MKKFFYLISFSLLFLVSCSSDSSTETTPSNVLLKQIIEGDVLLGGSVTTFTYNGNKIVKIKRNVDTDVYSDVYTYTGNLITKIEKFQIYYEGTSGEQNELLSTDEFSYNSNDKLIQFKTIIPNSDVEMVTTYVYNSNNTVTFEQNKNFPGGSPISLKTGTITLQDGEITQLQMSTEFDSNTYNYSYDAKNSIFKNVVGYDKLIFAHIIGKQGSLIQLDTIIGGISHNFVNSGDLQYTYNSENYPLTANQSWFGTVLHSFEFVYY